MLNLRESKALMKVACPRNFSNLLQKRYLTQISVCELIYYSDHVEISGVVLSCRVLIMVIINSIKK